MIIKINFFKIIILFIVSTSFTYAAELINPMSFILGDLEEGIKFKKEILFKNITNKKLFLVNATTSCGCTTVSIITPVIPAKGVGKLLMETDTTAKLGNFLKVIELEIKQNTKNATSIKKIELQVRGYVKHPKGREINPQVLFSGKCASCHVGENISKKQGSHLFIPICSMCHGDNLYKKNLDQKYLESAIRQGVPKTSMPGYSNQFGGPLTEEQVQSLVMYLLEKQKEKP